MPALRNVIIVAIGGARYAVELRWVREVMSLGFVTSVPTAPAALLGVCNLHGAIVPVLDVTALLGGPSRPPARQGDGVLVVEAEGLVCALRVDQVDHVASLHEDGETVMDTVGRPLVLLDPGRLVRQAMELVSTSAEHVA